MNVLFIGDIHNHTYIFNDIKRLDNIYNFDRIIFIGDYIDNWNTDNHDSLKVLETILNLKKSNFNKYTLCLGNHELSYLGYPCSGHKFNLDFIVSLKLKDNIDCFDLYTSIILNNVEYVCTHAGINNKYIKNVLQGDWKKELNLINQNKLSNLYLTTMCSSLRGGHNEFSSFLWCDKREHEYFNKKETPIIPNQIIGHTPVHSISTLKNNSSVFYFIDTHSTLKDGTPIGDKSYLACLDDEFKILL